MERSFPQVKVRRLTKVFRRMKSSYGFKDILLHSISWLKERKKREFTVLDDISFTLEKGESIAILGANGAGKSTLLAILAGILEPTYGYVRVRGRIGLMLELGTGLCHDLSGRENIMLIGLILGASKAELKAAEEDIIEFSGVRDFIDEPMRTYSTGMQTRLSFSIAVHIKPSVLIIDEVLAVGDSEFRRKCLQRLKDMQNDGVTIVLVTHSLYDAIDFCGSAIYLENGKVRFQGPTQQVADEIVANNCEY